MQQIIDNLSNKNNVLLSEYLKVDLITSEKINQTIAWFLNESEKQNFIVYKTHLLKFFTIAEMMYAKEFKNKFINHQFAAMKNGPVPSKLKDLIDNLNIFLNNIEMVNYLSFKIESKNNIKRIYLNNFYERNMFFFSKVDLEIMKRSLNKILELKTTKKLSDYTHQSESYNYFYNEAKKQKKLALKMNFSKDFKIDGENEHSIVEGLYNL